MTARKKTPSAATRNLSIKTFAELCDVSQSTVRNMIARGDIRVARIGVNVRIPVTECDRLGLCRPSTTEDDAA